MLIKVTHVHVDDCGITTTTNPILINTSRIVTAVPAEYVGINNISFVNHPDVHSMITLQNDSQLLLRETIDQLLKLKNDE